MNSKSIFAGCLLAVLGSVSAQDLAISTGKVAYQVYEPVYLKIERTDSRQNPKFIFGGLEAAGMARLKVKSPDGKEEFYSAPAIDETDPNDESQFVAYSTLLFGRNELFTSRTGTYELQLFGNDGRPVSNKTTFHVEDAKTAEEKKAKKLIESNPGEYAKVIYLEGGDHLTEGMAIVKKLAEGNTAHGKTSKAVLAMTYSQVSYDWGKGEIRRNRDLAKSEALLEGMDETVGEYLQLKAGATLVEQAGGKAKLSPSLRKKVEAIQYTHRASRSSLKRSLEN